MVFTLGKSATGGSRKTIAIARGLGKPCLHLARDAGGDAVQQLREFIEEHGIRALNVAGSRESKEAAGIGAWVGETLSARRVTPSGAAIARAAAGPPAARASRRDRWVLRAEFMSQRIAEVRS